MSRKVAFVTGASRGIGRCAALALAERGFDLVVTARTMREGEEYEYGATRAASKRIALPGSIELTAKAVQALGREALPIRLDLLDPQSIDAALERTYAEWGHIDVLLNNGIYQGPGLMERVLDIEGEDVVRIFEGNVFAQIHITQRVVRRMLERGEGGSVINMTSGSALMDPPRPTGEGGWGYAYAASKAAFHKLAGILHVEHADDGIRAFNLNPGFVPTEAQKAIVGKDEFSSHFAAVGPEVPAAVIAWLAASPEADAYRGGRHVDAQRLCAELGLIPSGEDPKGRGAG